MKIFDTMETPFSPSDTAASNPSEPAVLVNLSQLETYLKAIRKQLQRHEDQFESQKQFYNVFKPDIENINQLSRKQEHMQMDLNTIRISLIGEGNKVTKSSMESAVAHIINEVETLKMITRRIELQQAREITKFSAMKELQMQMDEMREKIETLEQMRSYPISSPPGSPPPPMSTASHQSPKFFASPKAAPLPVASPVGKATPLTSPNGYQPPSQFQSPQMTPKKSKMMSPPRQMITSPSFKQRDTVSNQELIKDINNIKDQIFEVDDKLFELEEMVNEKFRQVFDYIDIEGSEERSYDTSNISEEQDIDEDQIVPSLAIPRSNDQLKPSYIIQGTPSSISKKSKSGKSSKAATPLAQHHSSDQPLTVLTSPSAMIRIEQEKHKSTRRNKKDDELLTPSTTKTDRRKMMTPTQFKDYALKSDLDKISIVLHQKVEGFTSKYEQIYHSLQLATFRLGFKALFNVFNSMRMKSVSDFFFLWKGNVRKMVALEYRHKALKMFHSMHKGVETNNLRKGFQRWKDQVDLLKKLETINKVRGKIVDHWHKISYFDPDDYFKKWKRNIICQRNAELFQTSNQEEDDEDTQKNNKIIIQSLSNMENDVDGQMKLLGMLIAQIFTVQKDAKTKINSLATQSEKMHRDVDSLKAELVKQIKNEVEARDHSIETAKFALANLVSAFRGDMERINQILQQKLTDTEIRQININKNYDKILKDFDYHTSRVERALLLQGGLTERIEELEGWQQKTSKSTIPDMIAESKVLEAKMETKEGAKKMSEVWSKNLDKVHVEVIQLSATADSLFDEIKETQSNTKYSFQLVHDYLYHHVEPLTRPSIFDIVELCQQFENQVFMYFNEDKDKSQLPENIAIQVSIICYKLSYIIADAADKEILMHIAQGAKRRTNVILDKTDEVALHHDLPLHSTKKVDNFSTCGENTVSGNVYVDDYNPPKSRKSSPSKATAMVAELGRGGPEDDPDDYPFVIPKLFADLDPYQIRNFHLKHIHEELLHRLQIVNPPVSRQKSHAVTFTEPNIVKYQIRSTFLRLFDSTLRVAVDKIEPIKFAKMSSLMKRKLQGMIQEGKDNLCLSCDRPLSPSRQGFTNTEKQNQTNETAPYVSKHNIFTDISSTNKAKSLQPFVTGQSERPQSAKTSLEVDPMNREILYAVSIDDWLRAKNNRFQDVTTFPRKPPPEQLQSPPTPPTSPGQPPGILRPTKERPFSSSGGRKLSKTSSIKGDILMPAVKSLKGRSTIASIDITKTKPKQVLTHSHSEQHADDDANINPFQARKLVGSNSMSKLF